MSPQERADELERAIRADPWAALDAYNRLPPSERECVADELRARLLRAARRHRAARMA